MCVRDDLRCVEALLKSIDVALTEGGAACCLRGGVEYSCFVAQVYCGGEASLIDRRSDEPKRLAVLEGVDDRPLASSLLTRSIEDLVDKVFARGITMTKDLGCDLYEVATELPFVPSSEDFAHLLIGLAADVAEISVGISYELHIAILDTVVHHLDEMTGTAFTYPGTARSPVLGLSCNAGEDRLNAGPSFFSATRHDGRTVQSTLFTARDTTADEVDPVIT